MYVDKYRFAQEPEHLAELEDKSALRALLRHPRAKAGIAARYALYSPQIRRAYRTLANEESRRIFMDILRYRLLGAPYAKLAQNEPMFRQLEAVMADDIPSSDPPYEMGDLLGQKVKLWNVQYGGRPLEVVAIKYALYWVLHSDQYYYKAGNVSIRPEPGDVILDGGAFLGEISMRFAIDVGPEGRVFAFDPFPRHAQLATLNAKRNGLADRIRFVPAGISGKSNVSGLDQLAPVEDSADAAVDAVNPGRRMDAGDAMLALDDFADWAELDKVDYIKMDIEGSEADALAGCDRIIHKWRPKLAISVYHRFADLWTITNDLKARYPFYRFYLGHHSLHSEETVLYAIAD
ncbi:MAG TPA: FkbM family methyltransferase [Allosphingosinicella sp.]|jgi:FkbM family methyltransferase|nr:FkbM family methyltransferase [Allosphingosinicella sp.]